MNFISIVSCDKTDRVKTTPDQEKEDLQAVLGSKSRCEKQCTEFQNENKLHQRLELCTCISSNAPLTKCCS